MTDQTADLGIHKEGPLLRLRLQRPERRNAMTREMLAQLIDRIENATDDAELRVIVLCGEGAHFCSGMDLTAVNAPTEEKPLSPMCSSPQLFTSPAACSKTVLPPRSRSWKSADEGFDVFTSR